jgi:hypothetical protein
MKKAILFFLLAASAMGQQPTPSPSATPSKEAIKARIAAQVAAKRQAEYQAAKAKVESGANSEIHSALEPSAGMKPGQNDNGEVYTLDKQIRKDLKDPGSLIYEKWSRISLGETPGNNPAWVVTVTYRAKNGYGAYNGNTTETYYWHKEYEAWLLLKTSDSN